MKLKENIKGRNINNNQILQSPNCINNEYSSKSSTMRSEKLVFVENEAPKKEKIDPTTISKKELELKEFEEEQKKKKLKEQLEVN